MTTTARHNKIQKEVTGNNFFYSSINSRDELPTLVGDLSGVQMFTGLSLTCSPAVKQCLVLHQYRLIQCHIGVPGVCNRKKQ